MVFSDITKALIKAVEAGGFEWPISHENVAFDSSDVEFDDVNNRIGFLEMFNLPAQPVQASLGDQGCDRHDGILQITLNYPLNQGRTEMDAKADQINSVFFSGKTFTENEINVRINNVGINSLAAERGFARMAMSIEYYAYSARIT